MSNSDWQFPPIVNQNLSPSLFVSKLSITRPPSQQSTLADHHKFTLTGWGIITFSTSITMHYGTSIYWNKFSRLLSLTIGLRAHFDLKLYYEPRVPQSAKWSLSFPVFLVESLSGRNVNILTRRWRGRLTMRRVSPCVAKIRILNNTPHRLPVVVVV